jgi:hypothetical protein
MNLIQKTLPSRFWWRHRQAVFTIFRTSFNGRLFRQTLLRALQNIKHSGHIKRM